MHKELMSQELISHNMPQTIMFAKSMNKYAEEIINATKKTHIYQLLPQRHDTIASILTFRNILEQLQREILQNKQNKYLTKKTAQIYCNALQKLGSSYDSLDAEIAHAIVCMSTTKLSEHRINLQINIQKIFFPFESYLATLTKFRHKIEEPEEYLKISAESAATNLINLRKLLIRKLVIQQYATKQLQKAIKYKSKTLDADADTKKEKINYINFVKRLEQQARKLLYLAIPNLSKDTIQKLKKICN